MKNWMEEKNGKVVNQIFIGTGQEAYVIKNTAELKDGKGLIFEYTFCGDHDEGWVCQLNQNGQETKRINAKYITEIEWLF